MVNDFSTRLQQLRARDNVTQSQLAKDLGFTNQNVCDWEAGKSGTTFDKLISIANYFQVTTDYLLGNSNSSNIHYNTSVNKNMFAFNLKQLRTQNHLTQKQLAEALNISNQNINDWENEKSETTFDKLISIANYFQVTVDYLLGNSDY